VDACPTNCILPDRTLDARRCISFLTIENKSDIPESLRPAIGNWVFGCDICQMVCPWNKRFAAKEGDPLFSPRNEVPFPDLTTELALTPQMFNEKFKHSPVKRAKRKGYLRNVAVALGNTGDDKSLPVLEASRQDSDPLISDHIRWAQENIHKRRKH
jgi:epoxyqueuosine reductase